MSTSTIILLAIVAIVVYLIYVYNRLVSLQKSAEAAWSDIEVQLRRRYNLIPALVEVVKGAKNYEAETLEKVIQARSAAMSAKTPADEAKANNMLTQALGKLFALAESYPELKANQNFLELQQQLAQIEDSIQNARRYYNAVVRDYNARLDSFPDLFIARRFDFRPKDYFELDESIKEQVYSMPKIDLD